jgi:hypothetical protein
MNDENRINLDEDLSDLQATLAQDVAEAEKTVKDRKAVDAQRDSEQKKDSATKYGLIAIGAILIFILAYWMTFVRGATPEEPTIVQYSQPAPAPVAPRQQVTPRQPINRPPVNPTQPRTPPPGQNPDEYARPDM